MNVKMTHIIAHHLITQSVLTQMAHIFVSVKKAITMSVIVVKVPCITLYRHCPDLCMHASMTLILKTGTTYRH